MKRLIAIAMVLASAENSMAAGNYDIYRRPLAGMVDGWDFSGGRVTGAKGNSGTLRNGAAVSGRSVLLDGVNDCFEMSDGFADSLLTTTFTLSAWVSPSSPGSSLPRSICGRYQIADGKRSVSFSMRHDVAGTPIQFSVYDNSENVLYCFWNTTLPTSGWTHFAVTFDSSSTGNEMACYRDGVALSRTSRTTDPLYSPQKPKDSGDPIFIGSNNNVGTAQGPFKGNIAGFLPFTRVLSASEIAQLYNAGASRIANGGTP